MHWHKWVSNTSVSGASRRSVRIAGSEQTGTAAVEGDAEVAKSEWFAEWREELSVYVSRELLEAAVVPGRGDLPRVPGRHYRAGFDGASGQAQHLDSSALAI